MNAESELLRAYREWRRLTEAEGKAICRRDWKFLSDCHRALQSLQPLITHLRKQTRDEWKLLGINPAEKENRLRAVVLELMETGRRNHTLLQSLLESAQSRLNQLDDARRNLKRLRNSYAGVPAT